MAKKDVIEVFGKVLEAQPNAMFKVELVSQKKLSLNLAPLKGGISRTGASRNPGQTGLSASGSRAVLQCRRAFTPRSLSQAWATRSFSPHVQGPSEGSVRRHPSGRMASG